MCLEVLFLQRKIWGCCTAHYIAWGVYCWHIEEWRARQVLFGNADLTLSVSACRISLKAAAQGEVWLRVKVQRLGAPLVTHLAPSKEAKEAGGNACHCVQQGGTRVNQGLLCDWFTFTSSDPACCFVSVSTVHSSTFLAHVLFLQRESCLKSECVFAEHYMERCILLSSAVHFFFFFFFLFANSGDCTGMWERLGWRKGKEKGKITKSGESLWVMWGEALKGKEIGKKKRLFLHNFHITTQLLPLII